MRVRTRWHLKIAVGTVALLQASIEACHHFPIHLKHVIIEKRESFQGDAVLHIQVNGYGICKKVKADIVFSFIG